MAKVSKNQRCPCGSGLKFKHCCKRSARRARSHSKRAAPKRRHLSKAQPVQNSAAELKAHIDLLARQAEANEHQRRLMQGLGKPIISTTHGDFRFVAVGNTVWYSNKWKTFTDFLSEFAVKTLGEEWFQGERSKPRAEQNPIVAWYEMAGEAWNAAGAGEEGVRTVEATGAMKAFFGLAYDLYLSAHNAELPELLIKRLKSRSTEIVEGAVYEAYVIGCFARAGFSVEMEDEADSSTTHCELNATHTATGKTFAVEAKAVRSTASRAGASEQRARIRHQLYNALKKETQHTRIVFIELSRTFRLVDGQAEWRTDVASCIEEAEAAGTDPITINGGPAPSAYVFVTNRSFVHELEGPATPGQWAAAGFQIPDFPCELGAQSLAEMVDARDRHDEVYRLLIALQEHDDIPVTFDSTLPEQRFGDQSLARLRIGERYAVPDESGKDVPGVLEEAVVVESWKAARGIFKLDSGRRIHVHCPLSEDELRAYRRSPETFFDVKQDVGGSLKHPLDCYDFMLGSVENSSREQLLELMREWPARGELTMMSQPELARHYCLRMAAGMWAEGAPDREIPMWPVPRSNG